MIEEKTLQRLFANSEPLTKMYWNDESLISFSQFYRGTPLNVVKGTCDCRKTMLLFTKHNIIARCCFDCYKILISPATVVDLFKLMILFERLDKALPNDTRNKFLRLPTDPGRKCMIELRRDVAAPYKGYIYYNSLEEAKNIFNHVKEVIAEEISSGTPVSIKRGCTDFVGSYPEYAKLDEDFNPIMEYPEEWQDQEQLAYKNNLGGDIMPVGEGFTYSKPSFDLEDAKIMLSWLKYAATIEDSSYMKITTKEIPKFKRLEDPPWKAVKY